jgi:hypothetical protein
MTTPSLLERNEKLEEILAAVGYEFGELVSLQAISDPNTATHLSEFWQRAKSATYNEEEAMDDLTGIVWHLTDMAAEASSVPRARGASE